MVRAFRFSRIVLVLAAAGLTSAAFALDLLEKMQAEVASIVKVSKGSVVTIEDDVSELGFFHEHLMKAGLGNTADTNKHVAEAIRQAHEELAKLAQQKAEKRDRVAEREVRAKLRALEEGQEDLQKKGLEVAREILEQTKGLAVRIRVPKSGTGFSIGEGYIVTTADVVEGMQKPIVITDDGWRIKAKVAGIDPDLNVAILTVPKRAELPALKWGDSAAAVPGYFAISIGNQSGQLNSAALNLVAGIRAEGTHAGKRFYPRLLQIAGTVGAGTSGAPLLNTKGEVIGMMAAVPTVESPQPGLMPTPSLPRRAQPLGRLQGISFKVAKPQGDSDEQPAPDPAEEQAASRPGVFTFVRPPVTSAGFALPANDVRPVVEALREGREIAQGFIGVVPMDEEKFESDGEMARVVRTVRVCEVVVDSPACKAGIAKNDILVSFNGKPITGSAEVRAVAITTPPGQILQVEVLRGKRTLKFEVKITERPAGIRKHKDLKPMKRSDSESEADESEGPRNPERNAS